jgi:hypothetical protein
MPTAVALLMADIVMRHAVATLAREELLREGVCLCLPAIGGNKIAIKPRKISAQDIVKLSICAAYVMQNRGIRSCNVEEGGGCSGGE